MAIDIRLSVGRWTILRLDVDVTTPAVQPALPAHNGAEHRISDRLVKHVLHLN
jgi:hypothetical protein